MPSPMKEVSELLACAQAQSGVEGMLMVFTAQLRTHY